jgi:hypothetical protein
MQAVVVVMVLAQAVHMLHLEAQVVAEQVQVLQQELLVLLILVVVVELDKLLAVLVVLA